MSKLFLAFYGDDFTGATDALEQLTLAGIRTALFVEAPTSKQLKKFPGLQAIGVAGMTRAMSPAAMEKELKPAMRQLKTLGARHVHYKVCSTFDSSPGIGSIGRVMDVAAKIFPGPFIPILAAAPALGRYTVFGTHFARYGIGSAGQIHRLDRHPAISKHPVTPMLEADLRRHLSKQTKKSVALFDVLKLEMEQEEARKALRKILAEKPDAILFDAVYAKHLALIGRLIDEFAGKGKPLFSVGSSGIEAALAANFEVKKSRSLLTSAATKVLIGSGSCSPVTAEQIRWALKKGFVGVAMDAPRMIADRFAFNEIERAAAEAARALGRGKSVIVYTACGEANRPIAARLKGGTAKVLGTALGRALRRALELCPARRICIAGGDTSSFAARALGIEALEMVAPLTPGAPLCRAHAPGSAVNGCEIVFKGGQVGAENYFEILRRGKI